MSAGFASFFKPPNSASDPPRLAVSLDGMDKCGKTHWAIVTAPDPLVVLTNDTGTGAIVTKARNHYKRRIAGVCELEYPQPTEYLKTSDLEKHAKEEWGIWKKQWSLAKEATQSLIQDKTVRTFVVDTGTALWKLCALAHFGKIKSITQNLREEANSDFQRWFWGLYKGRPDLNIVLLHQLKKEYKESSTSKEANWTGKYERDGFNKIGYAVDMTLRCGWESSIQDFYTEVEVTQATRYGAELVGKRWYGRPEQKGLEGDPSHFAYLAMSVFPETELEPEYWGLR